MRHIVKRVLRQFSALILALAFGLALTAANVRGEILFESGTLGPTGIPYSGLGGGTAPGSSGVTPDVFSGVRFELSAPALTTRVGGHFVADPRVAATTFFGAIVRLDDSSDFPNSGDLSTADVVGATVLAFPHPSAEVFGNLDVQLDPGWYALVFGSGLLGASGSGAAVLNNPDIGSPSYIAYQTGSGWLELSNLPGPFENYRLVVEGFVIPEPASKAMALLALSYFVNLRPSRQLYPNNGTTGGNDRDRHAASVGRVQWICEWLRLGKR